MAAIIRLEDGRGLQGSSLCIDALLTLIAEQVSDQFADLRVWLADMAGRPAPFQNLDLGGLDSLRRAEFYAAAERAHAAKLSEHPEPAEPGPAVWLMGRLLAMRASIERGEPPLALSDFDHVLAAWGPEDLSQLWGT